MCKSFAANGVGNWRLCLITTLILYAVSHFVGCDPHGPKRIRFADANEALDSLLNDREFGAYALSDAIDYGDEAVEALDRHKPLLKGIDYVQSGRIAVLLSQIDTQRNVNYLKRIWENPIVATELDETDPDYPLSSDVSLPKCVAAYALARLGYIQSLGEEDGFLLQLLDGTLIPKTEVSIFSRQVSLAILVIGHTQDPNGLPHLIDGIGRLSNRNFPEEVVEASALSALPETKVPLLSLLNNWKCPHYSSSRFFKREIHFDYGFRAFRALVALGEYQAIDVLINAFATEGCNDQLLVEILSLLTGENDLRSVEDWMRWRNGAGRDFSLSEEEINSLRIEIEVASAFYQRMYMDGNQPSGPPAFFSSLVSMRE